MIFTFFIVQYVVQATIIYRTKQARLNRGENYQKSESYIQEIRMIINTFPFLAFTSTLLHPLFAIDYHDGPSSPTLSSIRSEATAPEASSAAVMHIVQREKVRPYACMTGDPSNLVD